MLSVTIINALVPGSPNVFPIGATSIAAAIREHGHIVQFVDYQTAAVSGNKLDPETLYQFILTLDSTDIVAIGAMSANLPIVLTAIARLKQAEPDRLIILGGPGPTDTAEDIITGWPVDYVVVGEGEITICELLSMIDSNGDPGSVPGIWYKDNGVPRFTGQRPRITDLDAIIPPAYDLVDFADYSRGLHIMTSRGCPYHCQFCSTRSIWGTSVTERSIAGVVDEIESLRGQIDWITFCDDNLALKPDRVRQLCRELIQRDLVMPWMTYGRINLTTEDLVQEMAAAGCEEVFFGIESGSARVLGILNKQIDIARSRDIVRMTASHVLQVNTSYIWGYPFETIEDLIETLLSVGDDEREQNIVPHLYLLGPFVNTELYRNYHHLLEFDPTFLPNVSTIPMGSDLTQLPELVDFIRDHPRVGTPYYHYAHDELPQKRQIIQTIIDKYQGSQNLIGPGARLGQGHRND